MTTVSEINSSLDRGARPTESAGAASSNDQNAGSEANISHAGWPAIANQRALTQSCTPSSVAEQADNSATVTAASVARVADTDDTVTESEQFSDQATADNSSASENLPVRSAAPASGQPGVGGDDLSDSDQSDAQDAGGFGFKEAFAQCKVRAQRLKDSDKGSVTRRNDLLESAALVVHHPDWTADSFYLFCKSRELPCTRATLAKPYAAVIRAADRKIAPKVAHNYGIAVQYAIGEGCPSTADA